MLELTLSLNDPWFNLVKCGKKIYEGRRFTEKLASLSKGDIINIKHYTDNLQPTFKVIVEDIIKFKTFREALKILPLNEVLPIEGIDIEKGVEIYYKYVSLQTQEKDGIVMIKIRLLN